MRAVFTPSVLHGNIDAPASKSMAHRFLIGAALSGERCTLSGVGYSEDILATLDCLRALGVNITIDGDKVTVEPDSFMDADSPILDCRESGSTLRFFIPLALCMGREVTLRGSKRLFERPLDIYEELCARYGFPFEKREDSVTLCGSMSAGAYKVSGAVSSQFITGLIFALTHLDGDSTIEIIPPFESRPYIDLTVSALKSFGADIAFTDEYKIEIKDTKLNSFSGKVEGDYSNAAFLDAFNYLGSSVAVCNLASDSLQGDRVYSEYFKNISEGAPTLNISDCPDLAPILFALAAIKNGATFTGTARLRMKESDRAAAMQEELRKLGGELAIGEDTVTVSPRKLQYRGESLMAHNDHRIVMALSVILSQIGGEIEGVEAVSKSYPTFFEDIKALGAKVELL